MRRVLIGLVVVGAALAGLAAVAVRIPAVQDFVVERAIERLAVGRADHLFEEDAMRVLLCGTSSPLPHPTRAGPCTAIFAAGRLFVVDVGSGSNENLALWRIDQSKLVGIFLTHFHSDHIPEISEYQLQGWVAGRPRELVVFGPPGVKAVVLGMQDAYNHDRRYRMDHHGRELLPLDVSVLRWHTIGGPFKGRGTETVIDEEGLRVQAFLVDHEPVRQAYGYRFEFGGRTVVVSGDTKKTPSVIEAAQGADVLVHEAQSNHLVGLIRAAAEEAGRDRIAKIMSDIPSYHATPVEAAEVANEAGVALLVMTHLTPPPPVALVERVFVRGVDDVRPDGWVLGDDGMLIELPIESDEIRVGRID